MRRYKAEGKQGMEMFHAYPALSFRKPDGSDSFFFLVPTVCPAPMAEDTDVEEFDIIRQRTNACAWVRCAKKFFSCGRCILDTPNRFRPHKMEMGSVYQLATFSR